MHRYCLLLVVGISIILAFGISELISSLDGTFDESTRSSNAREIRNPKNWPKMDEKFKNIFWVAQITDIHTSIFHDVKRGPDLLTLCQAYIKLIDPETVFVTGDLTDAKLGGGMESMQIRDEWIAYQNIIKKCSAMTRGRWIDIRGNHDCFDVHDPSSSKNYYRLFSATGPVYERKKDFEEGFIHSIEQPYGSYSFVGIDTCKQPGPQRPFNFFGYMDEKQMKHLKYLSAVTATSNHTVWFGHFPTSVIVQSSPALREIMSGSIMYLCGHLHTLGNLVPHMYARHKTGQLELELGDWKDNRVFRIIAFDHDLVSFVDVKFGQWPIILVTNPKNMQHLSPAIEPVEMIAFSSHIRILIFSPTPVKQVTVHIDNQFEGSAQQLDPNHPLYVLPWNPRRFTEYTHKLLVTAVTADKKTAFVTQHFSVEGKESDFELFPRLLLMFNIYTLGKILFGLCVFLYILVLTSLRQYSSFRKCLFQGMHLKRIFVRHFLIKFWLASRISTTYYILIGSVLYMAFGPWFVGYLLTDHIGVVFAWGIIINGTFLPGGLTYFYGTFQFFAFTVPLSLVIGHILDVRRQQGREFLFSKHIAFVVSTGLLFLLTAYLSVGDFRRAYGMISVLVGPLRTGNLILLPVAIRAALRADLKEIVSDDGHF